jgi:hypothetical protein
MPFYEVIGTKKGNNNRIINRYRANDKAQARMLGEKDGLTVETIVLVKPSAASQNQVDLAQQLGLKFPSDINVMEIGQLITKKIDGDVDVPDWFRKSAFNYFPGEDDVLITKYMGLASLIGLLIAKFKKENNYYEWIKLFIYCVLNDLLWDNWNTPFYILADKKEINRIAQNLLKNEILIGSLKNYTSKSYIAFGEHIDSNGVISSVGTKRTAAYQAIKDLLIEKKIVRISKDGKIEPVYSFYSSANKSGCFGVLIILLTFPVILGLYFFLLLYHFFT